jgi:hypothetical protein
MNRLRHMVLASFLAIAAHAAAESSSLLDHLEEARQHYDLGLELKATKPADARAEFAKSSAALEALIAQGADNAPLYFNLGNAYVQSGDLGRGIASYLRARRLAPFDEAIQANLASARTDVPTKIGGDAVSDGSRIAWWRFIGEGPRLWLAISLWLLFWGLVALPIIVPSLVRGNGRTPLRWLRPIRAAALLASLITGSTVAIDRWLLATRPLGVIVAQDVVVRKGNGLGFEMQVAEKLGPGVECLLLEERPGWMRVLLADGTEGWVQTNQVEPV